MTPAAASFAPQPVEKAREAISYRDAGSDRPSSRGVVAVERAKVSERCGAVIGGAAP